MLTDENDFRRKIKSKEEILEMVGPRPRKKTVIMCHGTFDLVHPGHIRHLMHAKSKGDFLIASLTCDTHVTKADHRPYVPEQLRAMNLAALEVVDCVHIDQNATPIEAIKFIQPDFFAKGYEYHADGIPAKTAEEIEVLENYGGEIIFTPGDVVYSSSAIIERAPPNLSVEKLVTLMESEDLTFDDLRSAVESFAGVRVHVVGDTIVDSYNYCAMIGSGTAKTPTISVRHERRTDFVGGAAVVAKHLRRSGASVEFTTVLGDDLLKDFILDAMQKEGIDCRPTIDPSRVTTQKSVYIADNYRLLKVDQVDNSPISDHTLDQFKESVGSSAADVFVFSDFKHGIFNRNSIAELTSSLPEGKLKVADTQVASRWGNILDFQGFDLITPNEREARFALAEQDSGIRPLCLELYRQTKCKHLIMKMGDRGIITYRSDDADDFRSFFIVDSFVENVVDAVGAGDALLSYATLSLAATKSPVIASILGSMAAAVSCEHEGNYAVNPADVRAKLDQTEKRALFA